MQQYPYEATLVQKEVVKQPVNRVQEFAFLFEVKAKLEPNQAIQVAVPAGKRQSLTDFWRKSAKGQEPHTLSKRKADGSYVVYLWLGPLV